MTSDVAARLATVRDRIAAAAARAGRPPGEVAVLAVTKTFPVGAVVEATRAGVDGIGENRAQELLGKAAEVPEGVEVEWHFVGRIQRNKVPKLAGLVSVWHSVDRPEVGAAVARHAPGAAVYVQVDLAGEPQKGGCEPGRAPALVGDLRELGLDVRGLMTVPPLDDDPRPFFARLAALAQGCGVVGLSMGMSGDYEVAVEEGATVVRLGTALFGRRAP